jgi:zinc/manganese transport system substrate-binding protein
MTTATKILAALAVLLPAFAPFARAQDAPAPIKVCATTPDLGSLVREVGGERVSLTVFAKPTEDPHFIEAKPGFIKAASEAELFVQTGLELEVGWAPAIIQNARNDRIKVDAPGFLDASTVITPLEVPAGAVDRSMGDVHPGGNPHFLVDPVSGLKVARLIAQRLGELRPADKTYFDERMGAFKAKLDAALVGPELAKKYDAEKLARLAEAGRLKAFLDTQSDASALGGWLGDLAPYYGTRAVSDHNLWSYFAQRFSLVVTGYMEPKPGVPPTTRHLRELVDAMKAGGVKLLLTSPYFDQRAVALVAEGAGASIAHLAHQPGSRPGTDDYLSMCAYNVAEVAKALKETR